MANPIVRFTPPSVALIGASGAGKTTSIVSLAKAGLEVFFLATEPNATDALFDAIDKQKLPWDKFHWHQVAAATPGWDALEENANIVKKMSYSDIAELKQGISKQVMAHWMDLLKCCKNFPDDNTGNDYGDVTKWDDSRVLVIDSLSGLNKMAREYVVGYKPTMHQGEWGVAMQLEENLLYKLVYDRSCFFVLIAHIDREVDEVAGGTKITMSALGRKLAPQLIKTFSEVVLAKREGAEFYWSTSETQTDVKNRALPIGAKLLPDFRPIVEAHRRRVTTSTQGGAAPVTTT